MNDESALEGQKTMGATAGVAGGEASGANGSAPATVPAVLRAAADLIEPEGHWVQGFFALDTDGRETISSSEAACLCASGSIKAAAGLRDLLASSDLVDVAREYLMIVIGTRHIPEWNDDPARTQAEVVATLRKAADLADGVPAARPLADASQVPGIIE